MISKSVNLASAFVNFINRLPSYYIASLVFLFLTLISYFLRDVRPLACDMSEYLNNPLRILNGDLPYKNFWLLFSPGEVYFPFLIYKIFGLNTDIARLCTIFASTLTVVVAFYFGRLLGNKNFASIIFSFLFFFTSVIYNYEGPDYNHLYLSSALLSIFFLVRFYKSEKMIDIFLSGLFIGCGFYFRLYETGAIFAAFGISAITYFIINKKTFSNFIRHCLIYLSGIVIILCLTLMSFSNMIPTLYHEIVVESVGNGTSMDLPYFYQFYELLNSINNDLGSIFAQKSYANSILLIYHLLKLLPTLFYYIGPLIFIFCFVLFILSKPDKKQIPIALALFLWSFISFPKGLGRSDIAHMAPSVMPGLLLLWFIIQNINIKQKGKLIKPLKYISIASISIMMLTFLYPVFNFINLYAKPLTYVKTNHGAVPFKSKKDAEDFRAVINYINENSTVNDYIFVTPWDAPPIYALTNRRDPTYYDSLNDLMVRPSDDRQKKLCQDIADKNTKIIIHNADWGYDNKPEQMFKVACSVLQNYIVSNYTLAKQYGFYSIYVLKDQLENRRKI